MSQIMPPFTGKKSQFSQKKNHSGESRPLESNDSALNATTEELAAVLATIKDARALRQESARSAQDLASGLAKLERLTEEMRTALEGLPEMDMTRVIELNDRLEKGKFAIDSRSLADKMLNFDRDSSQAIERPELPSKD